MSSKPPEEWEASDHIENLKRGIPAPGLDIPGLCKHHSSVASALVWIIRRIDVSRESTPMGSWVQVAVMLSKTGPFGLLAGAVAFCAFVAGKIWGVL